MIIAVIFVFAFIHTAMGQTNATPQIEVLARIQTTGHAVKIIRLKEGDSIPSLLNDKKLEKVISDMGSDKEAIVKGHISYHATTLEGQAKVEPIFIIESIHPVSLKLLGKVKTPDDNEMTSNIFKTHDQNFSPLAIPVTTEVASAITITSALLLMQSLAANPGQPGVTQQLNTGLFLSAGILATGVFIFDQLKGNNKK